MGHKVARRVTPQELCEDIDKTFDVRDQAGAPMKCPLWFAEHLLSDDPEIVELRKRYFRELTDDYQIYGDS